MKSISLFQRSLRVPLKDLHAWLIDEESPPAWVFLRAVDLRSSGPPA